MHTLTRSATSPLLHTARITRPVSASTPRALHARCAKALSAAGRPGFAPAAPARRGRGPVGARAALIAAPAVPFAAHVAAVSAVRLAQDPAFRVILGAAGAFAGAVASDAWINETGSPAIIPMGAVLGAGMGFLLPRMASNPIMALCMCMAGILGGDLAQRTMNGLPEDVREMSKIAALGCAVALGVFWL